MIATSSEDQTVRLWDLRVKSSVKLFRDEQMKEQDMANLVFTPTNKLLVAASKTVYQFDLGTDKIITN